MNNGDPMKQGILYDLLAAVSNDGDAAPVAGGIRAWELLIEQLSPVVGEIGLCALFARARHMASPQRFPLPSSSDMRSSAILLEQLESQLAEMDPAASLAFNTVLLETFVKLLSSLIGEALTARLLNTAWAVRPGGKLP